jgi:hypothetical protein
MKGEKPLEHHLDCSGKTLTPHKAVVIVGDALDDGWLLIFCA